MAIAIEMPKLSDTMEEGVIARWNIKEGDKVKSGDIIAEVETDKATMDLEAFDDGTVLKILVEEGETVPLGEKLVILGEEGEDISDLVDKADRGEKEAALDKKEKEKSGEAKKEVTGEAAGDEAGDATGDEETVDKKEEVSETETDRGSDGRVKASPLARKMAEEQGVDLSKVKGSGPQGRVVKADIENLGEEALAAAKERETAGKPGYKEAREAVKQPADEEKRDEAEKSQAEDLPQPAVTGTSVREDKELKVSQMRKTIGKRLAESKFSSPHFYETVDIDMKKAMAVRTALNEFSDVKISFNDLVVKACAVALRQHPWVNSTWMGDVIRMHGDVNVAVAVAVEEGLLTPVIRHTDQKGLRDISIETKQFAARARDKKLQPEDWEGSTFTVSNLGMFGIEEFTAIINPPNASILAIGAIRDVPVVEEGKVVPGKRMKVTLSSDHRLVDGVKAAEFLNTVRNLLENPESMLL